MGRESPISPAFQMTRACTRTPRPARRAPPAGPPDPASGSPLLTWSPARRSPPGARAQPAARRPDPGPRSPLPHPDPGPRAPLAGSRTPTPVPARPGAARPDTRAPRPAPRAASEAPGQAAGPEPPPALALPGGSGEETRRQPPGRGRGGERPRVPGCGGSHSHSVGNEQAALDHHVREEIQLEGRSHVLGARAALRSGGGGRLCARPSGRGRRETGRDRCARPPGGGRPSRHLSHPLPSRSPPIPSESQRPGDGLRSARCGERRRSSAPAAPPLNPCGPARPAPGGRDPPEAGGRGS